MHLVLKDSEPMCHRREAMFFSFGMTTPRPKASRGHREQEGRGRDVDQYPEMVSMDMLPKVVRLVADKTGTNTGQNTTCNGFLKVLESTNTAAMAALA